MDNETHDTTDENRPTGRPAVPVATIILAGAALMTGWLSGGTGLFVWFVTIAGLILIGLVLHYLYRLISGQVEDENDWEGEIDWGDDGEWDTGKDFGPTRTIDIEGGEIDVPGWWDDADPSFQDGWLLSQITDDDTMTIGAALGESHEEIANVPWGVSATMPVDEAYEALKRRRAEPEDKDLLGLAFPEYNGDDQMDEV